MKDPNSTEGKTFRLRFRVPYAVFQSVILPKCKESNIFGLKNSSPIPLEFKILCSLRILGRASDFDSMSEISQIPKSTCHRFFHKFVSSFYHEYVYFPQGKKLLDVTHTYARVGFPGACGSMDVTHLHWDNCPSNMFNFCKGKYPFPTLAVQAIVDHNRRILYLSNLYNGRANDLTIYYSK